MDLGTAILGGTFSALCAMPFIATSINRKKREKKLYHAIKTMAAKHKSNITDYGTCGHLAIGMDSITQKLFFYKSSDENTIENVLDMKQIMSCNIQQIRRPKKHKTDRTTAIDTLDLNFTPKESQSKSITWRFFNSEDDALIAGELELIEQWNQKINAAITS
ncbi:hypothetical protein [Formosa sp. S-31]|uniref:hypothetical protein n=1 Tax=Formosa sp. S-31 TaxID=2790949 RepID=UPI003EB79A89